MTPRPLIVYSFDLSCWYFSKTSKSRDKASAGKSSGPTDPLIAMVILICSR